jgi:hypothetical protein
MAQNEIRIKARPSFRVPSHDCAAWTEIPWFCQSAGLVLFAHESGKGRLSSRNRFVAEQLQGKGLGTLLFDLLRDDEAADRRNVFNVLLLAERPGDLTGSIWTGLTERINLEGNPGRTRLPPCPFSLQAPLRRELWTEEGC